MKLQRPIMCSLHWAGHRWPVVLRVAPTSRLRLPALPPANDDAWPAPRSMPLLTVVLFGAPENLDPREWMIRCWYASFCRYAAKLSQQ